MKVSIIFTFLIVLASHLSFAQLNGSYIYSAGVDAGSRTLIFNGSNFKEHSSGHLNGTFGEGSFKLENDQLTLTYFKLKDQDSSVYKIDSDKALYGYSSVFAQVFSDKLPINGASIVLRNSSFEPVFSASTLVNGTASFRVNKDEALKFLTVDFIGYKGVVIPFDRIEGRKNDIFVDLKYQATMIEPPHVSIYRVASIDEKNLKLIDSSNTKLIFKKLIN